MPASIGRIVIYTVSADDAARINKRRKDFNDNTKENWPLGAQAHVGNDVAEGDQFPMIVTRVWEGTANLINGQVMLDGNDNIWKTSLAQGDGPNTWMWPVRV